MIFFLSHCARRGSALAVSREAAAEDIFYSAVVSQPGDLPPPRHAGSAVLCSSQLGEAQTEGRIAASGGTRRASPVRTPNPHNPLDLEQKCCLSHHPCPGFVRGETRRFHAPHATHSHSPMPPSTRLLALAALVSVVAASEADEEYLKGNAAQPGVTVLPSGLQYKVMSHSHVRPEP